MSIQILVFFKEKYPNLAKKIDQSIFHALIVFLLAGFLFFLIENNMIRIALKICKLLDKFNFKTNKTNKSESLIL